MLQTGGITYFDRMDFNAFNKRKCLKRSALKHHQLFGHLHQLSADRIYSTNENRRYLTARKIFTNFIPKGRNTLTNPEKVSHAPCLLLTGQELPNIEIEFSL